MISCRVYGPNNYIANYRPGWHSTAFSVPQRFHVNSDFSHCAFEGCYPFILDTANVLFLWCQCESKICPNNLNEMSLQIFFLSKRAPFECAVDALSSTISRSVVLLKYSFSRQLSMKKKITRQLLTTFKNHKQNSAVRYKGG